MKRFYKEAGVVSHESAFAVALDGKPVKTKMGNVLALPDERIAQVVAEEWQQAQSIDAAKMPLTRVVGLAVDVTPEWRATLQLELLGYLGSDVVCHRADHPREWLERQEEVWNPLIAAFETLYGRPLPTTFSLAPQHSLDDTINAIASALEALHPLTFSLVHHATRSLGSLVIALLWAEKLVDTETAIHAALLEEFYQAEQWGEDEAASARRQLIADEVKVWATLIGIVKKS